MNDKRDTFCLPDISIFQCQCVFSLPHTSFIKGPFKVEIPTPHASLKMKKVVYSRAKTE